MENYFVHYAEKTFTGYGHYKIKVELANDGYNEFKLFSHTTTDMRGIGSAQELEGQEYYDALFNIIEYDIKDEIEEWLMSLSEENIDN